jgi:hypothetical protein
MATPGNRPLLSFRTTVILLALYTAFLLAYPYVESKQDVLAAFAEDGPFENLSSTGWLLLCSACLWNWKLSPRVLLPGALTALIGAAREDDLQNAVTGVNLFRLKWYVTAAAPLHQKLLAGAILLIVVGTLLYMLAIGARAFLKPGPWRQGWGLTLLLAMCVGGASVVLDKLQSFVHDFTGAWLHQQASLVVKALEEGLEMALPLLFLSALMQYRALARS